MTATHSSPVLVRDFSMEITAKDVARLNDARHAIPQGTPVNITLLGSEDTRARVRAADAVRWVRFSTGTTHCRKPFGRRGSRR